MGELLVMAGLVLASLWVVVHLVNAHTRLVNLVLTATTRPGGVPPPRGVVMPEVEMARVVASQPPERPEVTAAEMEAERAAEYASFFGQGWTAPPGSDAGLPAAGEVVGRMAAMRLKPVVSEPRRMEEGG